MSEENGGTSHLFGRLSSKEEDLFETLGDKAASEMTEEDLISQIESVQIETEEAIHPQVSVIETKPQLPAPTEVDDSLKNKIRMVWKSPSELKSIFDARLENQHINNSDFDLICQPRLGTFTTLQNKNEETDLRQLIKTHLNRKDYLEAFNLAGNVINSQMKPKDPFYVAHILDVWFSRFHAVLRLIETNNENYSQLAETEAGQFGCCEQANMFKQFFPLMEEQTPDENASFVPFGLRIIVLQILIKCGHTSGSNVSGQVSKLLRLSEKTRETLQTSDQLAFLTTEEARRYFEGVWSARVEGVNAAVCSALRLFDGPIHAAQYLLQVQTHKRTLKVKYLLDVIQIYLQCGLLQEARGAFQKMENEFNSCDSAEKAQAAFTIQNAKALIYAFQNSWEKAEEGFRSLTVASGSDWESSNNLGVSLFHQEKIHEAVQIYEAELAKQLSSRGVITPTMVYPIQRNLFTLNEMYKK